jgi:hypothetical protein
MKAVGNNPLERYVGPETGARQLGGDRPPSRPVTPKIS